MITIKIKKKYRGMSDVKVKDLVTGEEQILKEEYNSAKVKSECLFLESIKLNNYEICFRLHWDRDEWRKKDIDDLEPKGEDLEPILDTDIYEISTKKPVKNGRKTWHHTESKFDEKDGYFYAFNVNIPDLEIKLTKNYKITERSPSIPISARYCIKGESD